MPRHSESTLAAIKQAVDIVSLVGEYLPLHRYGSKFRALCPFHDDHKPSLELNSERQSYKCWACGAGGDIFDFVKEKERVDFPEAVRMLAERGGVTLEREGARPSEQGPSKSELLEANAWAERLFIAALNQGGEAVEYLDRRGLSRDMAARFRLGYAPEGRDWLLAAARRDKISTQVLERAGLVVKTPDGEDAVRARFRGRLIFPIHDIRGRVLGFGGRVLPSMEAKLAEFGRSVAKYLNSPETLLFQKRRNLYAADLAKDAARQAGWVAVVEGYTDVIAAHQVGLANVVGTLGTALGDDHVRSLRQLADRVVLIFDGDEAGQNAADRSLEFFLGHEVDVRVLTLPEGLDPCDYLLREGGEAFRILIDRAEDPLQFAIQRAQARFDFRSVEGARQAADWVLAVLARVPRQNRIGLDLKVAKALDTLGRRLGVSAEDLKRRLQQLRKQASSRLPRVETLQGPGPAPAAAAPPIRIAELEVLDREMVQIALNDPASVAHLIQCVPVASLRDEPLRTILQVSYELYGEGEVPTLDRVVLRLDDPAVKALALDLNAPIEPQPVSEGTRTASWDVRLANVLDQVQERQWQDRLRSLEGALKETDPNAQPEQRRALRTEYLKLLNQRPDPKTKHAS